MDEFKFTLKTKDELKHIRINFFSQYILDQLNMLSAGIIDIQTKFNLLSDIQDYLDNKKIDKKIKKELKEEKKKLQQSILEYGESGYLSKRWETIKQLLVDNGIEDKDLLDYEFWYKNVDRKEIKRFIQYCVIYSIEGDNGK